MIPATSKTTTNPKAPLLAAAMLPVFLLLGSCSAGPAHLDVTPYVSVCFAGEDGSGTAEVVLDENGLICAACDALELDEAQLADAGTRESAMAQQLISAVSLQVDPAEGLSNGDTVTVEGTVDLGLWNSLVGSRLEVSFTSFTAVVSGLSATEAIDPFTNVDVSWLGYAPELSMQLNLHNTTSAPWTWISYTTTAGAGLDVGDTVTVTAAADPDTLARLGYRLTDTEKTFTVPASVGRYASRWEDVDAAGVQTLLGLVTDTLDAMPRALPEQLYAVAEDGSTILLNTAECTDFAYASAKFLSAARRPAGVPTDWRNALVCVYCFNAPSAEDASVFYSAFALPDLAVSAAGVLAQAGDVWFYDEAAASPEMLTLFPAGADYRIADVSFDRQQTPETAS